MQIARAAVQHMQAEGRPGTPPLSGCHPATRRLSVLRQRPLTGDAGPVKGISSAAIVCSGAAAGFGCMLIQGLYFHSPPADRDARRPHTCSAALSERVGVTAPAGGPYYPRCHREERCDAGSCCCCLLPDLQVRAFLTAWAEACFSCIIYCWFC